VFDSLFSPARLGNLSLDNRVVMAPMATHFAGEDGRVSERLMAYYKARVAGGVGLIISESNYILPEGRGGKRRLGLCDDSFIEGHARMVNAIHCMGGRVCAQLHHGGKTVSPSVVGQFPVSASSVPLKGIGEPYIGVIPRKLSVDEIRTIIDAYGQAAARAKRAGFDAIQIHAAHGYLLHQFLSPLTNKRNDAFGGDANRRMRLILEVVDSVRRQVGADLPIMVRLSALEHSDGGYGFDFIVDLCRRLENAGVDEIGVSKGNYDELEWLTAPAATVDGYLATTAQVLKQEVGITIGVVGKIRTPQMADQIIREGHADLVYLGRALLADPLWPAKARAGKPEEIRYCISCNKGCIGRLFAGLDITCAINAAVGRESEEFPEPSPRKRVMVVGGGPAGLEFARVASERGHKVILFEETEALGGQLRVASKAPYKSTLMEFIEFLTRQALANGTEIIKSTSVDGKTVRESGCDVLVLASGSQPIIPDLPGAGLPSVSTAVDILNGKPVSAQSVAVVGGGLVGCEVAEFLADQGKNVVLIELLEEVLAGEECISKKTLLLRLCDKGVAIRVNTNVVSIAPGNLVLDVQGRCESISVDMVVLAIGSKPRRDLLKEIVVSGIKIYVIGDASGPGDVLKAIHEAFDTAHKI